MSMEELVLKMLFCLVAALLIGFLFGWLITRASAKGRYQEEIDEINNELIDKNVEIDNLARELSNHQELKKNLLADLEIKETELSGLHDVVGRQKNDLLAVKSDLDLKAKKVQELEKVIPSFESKVATLEDAYNAKNSKIVELEADYNNLRSEIGSLQIEQDKKDEEIQKLINEKNSYEAKVKELEKIVNQKNIASLELDQKVKEIDQYARENSKLKDNLNELNSKLESFQSELHEKDRKLSEVQNQLQERDSKLSNYQSELKNNNIDQNALSDLNDKYSRLQEEIRAAREEAESYKRSLAQSESRVQELQTSLKNSSTVNYEPTYQATPTPKPHINADLESDEGGFSFIKLAKDTISKLTDSGEDIIKKGDDAIDNYKNKKS
jgi:chromosome segregation ATPase